MRSPKAVNDVVNAVRGGKSDARRRGGRQGTVDDRGQECSRDTAKKVVKHVRQAAKDAREAAKDRTADDE